ncbi:hypothetical protein FQA47_019193 [Oryzias melastigma]|uniref:Uncharacterized protein n=1 Tax=Oryzias melastigma TaxID=30732 RepID=A0A834CBH4_ORYME|nr:hypothetical protein FQA47_019193 [Oryzias melastigma]
MSSRVGVLQFPRRHSPKPAAAFSKARGGTLQSLWRRISWSLDGELQLPRLRSPRPAAAFSRAWVRRSSKPRVCIYSDFLVNGCAMPFSCSTPKNHPSWTEVVVRGTRRLQIRQTSPPLVALSNQFAALADDDTAAASAIPGGLSMQQEPSPTTLVPTSSPPTGARNSDIRGLRKPDALTAPSSSRSTITSGQTVGHPPGPATIESGQNCPPSTRSSSRGAARNDSCLG